MKKLSISVASVLGALSLYSGTVILECERFAETGGWKTDSQFRLEMGSTYLIAHGLGSRVADAKTRFNVEKGGRYSVWARTKNWTAKWSKARGAGLFAVLVNGERLPGTMGDEGNGRWVWSKAGEAELKAGTNEVALCDLTGFDGRCDALAFTMSGRPPEGAPASRAASLSRTVDSDLTVVGGGIAGICTALSAARLGLKVALVQDRPVLGGANSSEVRVHLGGRQNIGKYPRLGDVVSEIGPAKGGNAMHAANYEDDRKMAAVKAEKNISLFLSTMVEKVSVKESGAIESVTGYDVVSGKATLFKSPLFVDCTGDATVGYLADADYRIGRESRAQTGEELAPEKADKMTMGSSVQWYAEKTGSRRTFPSEPWMLEFDESSSHYYLRGDWNWETGMNRDQLFDFETVRDYGLLVAYSNWAYVKNHGRRKDEFSTAALKWVAYVAGKRETRRLMGDHVLTQQDVCENRFHPDGTCMTTWTIDLHYPMPKSKCGFKGESFRSIAKHCPHRGSLIPYRCFYSRNVPNLFMAGRNISVTHVALGTTRVMRTHGMMGEVVGMAASVCRRRGCTPREVYTRHFDDLRRLMEKGVGKGGVHPPQNYNLGWLLSPSDPRPGAWVLAEKKAPKNTVWYDGSAVPMEGKAFKDVKSFYDRLPASAEGRVNPSVWNMSRQSSSLQFRFVTNAKKLFFRWKCLENLPLSSHTMAPAGFSGIDCYKYADGRWQYVSTGFVQKKDGEKRASGCHEESLEPGTPWLVNLPVYNGISEFQIGAPEGTYFKPLPPRPGGDRPVVFYGTSTTQGGFASRPGMQFVNRIGRTLDVPVVNLGFSGAGKMEMEMVDYLAGIDARLYVLDTIGNMSPRLLEERFEKFLRALRSRRPATPFLVCEERVYREEALSSLPTAGNRIIGRIVEKLKKEDPRLWKNLHVLKSIDMVQDFSDMSADGVHPNDEGLMEYARSYTDAVRKALLPEIKAPSCVIRPGESVAFMGDSITQFGNISPGGYVLLVKDALEEAGIPIKKLPAGISGHKSSDMLARLERDVLKHKPNWMTLSCGVNDVGHGKRGVGLDEFKKNVSEMLDRAEAAGVKTVVMTPTLLSEKNWRTDARNCRLDAYAQFLREEAARRSLPLADCNALEKKLLAGREKNPAPPLTVDGIHMSGYGNMMMAQAVLKAFGFDEKALESCRARWRTMPMVPPFLNNRNVPMMCISPEEYERIKVKASLKGQSVEEFCIETLRRMGN